MYISYEPLWHLLLERKMKKKDLRKATVISTAALAKLGKNKNINTDTLLKICEGLNCDISDILRLEEGVNPYEIYENKENAVK